MPLAVFLFLVLQLLQLARVVLVLVLLMGRSSCSCCVGAQHTVHAAFVRYVRYATNQRSTSLQCAAVLAVTPATTAIVTPHQPCHASTNSMAVCSAACSLMLMLYSMFVCRRKQQARRSCKRCRQSCRVPQRCWTACSRWPAAACKARRKLRNRWTPSPHSCKQQYRSLSPPIMIHSVVVISRLVTGQHRPLLHLTSSDVLSVLRALASSSK